MAAPVDFTEAMRYAAQRKVVLPEEYYNDFVGLQRSQAVSIAGLSSLEQISFVMEQLNKTLSDGGTFKDFKAAVRSGELAVDLPAHRLDNIFRTNIQAAYNRGRYEQQMRSKDGRPYWMYDAINDSRTRPNHTAMDGVILRHDDPWWTTHYPPNGYRCRCTVLSMTEAQAQKRGITATAPTVSPDSGWDYNPGADYKEPIKRSTRKTVSAMKKQAPTAAEKVDKVVDKVTAAAKKANPTLDDLLRTGRSVLDKSEVFSKSEWDYYDLEAANTYLREFLASKCGVPGGDDLFKHIRKRNQRFLKNTEVEGLAKAGDFLQSVALPESWVQNVYNRYHTVTFNQSTSRAYAQQITGLINANFREPDTVMHEFMHLVQVAMPQLQAHARSFHNRRTAGAPQKRLLDLKPNSTHKPNEVAREDNYFSAYCGREYNSRPAFGYLGYTTEEPLEILSMGFQYVFGGMVSGLRTAYGRDPEFVTFIVGLLEHYG